MFQSKKEALDDVKKCFYPGDTPAEVVCFYDNWKTYDETNDKLECPAPRVATKAIVRYLQQGQDISQVEVLDVAAGTGRVGKELKALGFIKIDALDPSEGMFKAIKDEKVYRKYLNDFFPCLDLSITTSSYDALVVCGAMINGHLKLDSLPEMVRCVKTGGLVVIACNENHLINVPEYKDRLEPLMKKLELEGQWNLVERSLIEEYLPGITGVLFVLRVTKPVH